ncbi:phosphatidylinositol-glycan biosynthesis class X protein [Teleopsis dalmanni]|uniref:phosphatidylinositol-glycan biosynthesis class X protein n=1 Tax=Teleopsis dalmanni TaxID=139649 RepID=UPI0018CD60A8|nr:phosphatidylinositol-glycan biosynthesis class X protein [Teleopsis dalmanni]
MTVYLVISTLLLLYAGWHQCVAEITPTISINMNEAGFHRNLKYNIQFEQPLADEACEYMLQQFLPAAVYVSKDQLDDLQRLNKLSAVYPNFVDIELSTEKAEPFTVLLKGVTKTTGAINLPIHFRYHAPSDKRFVSVDIEPPKMFIRCVNNMENLIDHEVQLTPGVLYCQNETTFMTARNNTDLSTNVNNCNWLLIKVNYKIKHVLRAKIPVGNEKSFPPILYATIILSWVVSIWTVMRTQHVPRYINSKLEQQRSFENKTKTK